MWLTLIFFGTAGLFLAWLFSTLWHIRWVRRLPALETPSNSEPVRCSIVIAARNEAGRIEQTVRRLLAQTGVELELIIVNDRSTDGTSDILARLANEDARVQVKNVDALPAGWLGKCHACHIGAKAATVDWILFTDADCWLKSDVVVRALGRAQQEGVDHLTLTSGLSGGLGLKASHLLFLISLANWFSGVNRDRPEAYMGIGAFNLVRAAAYRECGGYEALRLTVVDDLKLGLLLRRAGKRTRAFLGGDDADCHWGTTAWNMIKIMEKNYFAAVDYQLGLVMAGALFVLFVLSLLILGLLSGTAAGLTAALSPFLLVWPGGVLAKRLGWSWVNAIFVPLMMPLFLMAMVNSAFVTLRQGGIRWRDTFYSLDSLRAGNVQ